MAARPAAAKACVGGEMTFREAQVFALDEYGGLEVDDPGLCVSILRQHLVDAIDLPKDRFRWLDPQAPDVDAHTGEYAAAIDSGFDLTLLGIGLNGHLGLNEPGSAPDSTVRRVQMHAASVRASAQYVQQAALPTWGLTVGLKQLLSSKEVWLLATGKAKAPIVQRIVLGPVSPEVPASLMRGHPRCYFFLDAEAASLLR